VRGRFPAIFLNPSTDNDFHHRPAPYSGCRELRAILTGHLRPANPSRQNDSRLLQPPFRNLRLNQPQSISTKALNNKNTETEYTRDLSKIGRAGRFLMAWLGRQVFQAAHKTAQTMRISFPQTDRNVFWWF
jgi:hypothetical protein